MGISGEVRSVFIGREESLSSLRHNYDVSKRYTGDREGEGKIKWGRVIVFYYNLHYYYD